jgi:hypothetical protein
MIDQIGIAVFGLTSIALLAMGRSPYVYIGCVVGLISEPFWFWSAIRAEQWGIVLLAAAYSVIYILGIIGHRPRRPTVRPGADEHETNLGVGA